MDASHPWCLIAEDDALLGFALEDDLEEAGIGVVGPLASCAEALAWIEHTTPALAILDYKLRDGCCTELAGALLQRGVPVIIYSGWPPGSDMPPELRHVLWLEKPLDRNALVAAVGCVAPSLLPTASGGLSDDGPPADHHAEAAFRLGRSLHLRRENQ